MNHLYTRHTLRVRALGLAAVLLTLGNISPLSAASLYWDTNGNVTDSTYGGDGTWDNTNTYWNDSAMIGSGTALTAWNNSASPLDSANFLRTTTGTVTVSGTQTVGGLTLGASTGSFATGTGTAYTLTGGIIDIRVASFAVGLNNNTGTSTINSQVNWFGGSTTGVTNQQRLNINGGQLTLGGIVQDSSGVTGTHNLSLELYSASSLNITGNITKATGSSGITLLVGGTGTANNINVSLSGNNSGLTATGNTLNRGTLTLNSSGAWGTAASAQTINVANANSTVALADTAIVLIGTAGVSMDYLHTVTFASLTSTDTSDIRAIGGSNTTGTATWGGQINLGAFAPSGTGSSLQVTAASGGTVDFINAVTDNSNTSAITKTGAGTVIFSCTIGNSYDGGTTVSTGKLLVKNTSGSGTGTGAVSVSSGATFGGLNTGSANAGIISGAVTFASGSILAPGGSSGLANTLTFGSTLDISGLASGTGGLLFQLGTAGDKVALSSGVLTIGTGTLDLNDFSFTTLSGFGAGTYTLFDTSASIVGSFGSTLTGTVGGMNAVLSFTNGGQDVVLTVTAVPEPSTYAAVFGALALVSPLSAQTLKLSADTTGIVVDGGTCGSFVLPAPFFNGADKKDIKGVFTPSADGSSATVVYPDGFTVKVALSSEAGTITYSYGEVPEGSFALKLNSVLPVSYNGGTYATDGGKAAPFPATPDKQLIAQGTFAQLDFVGSTGEGLSFKVPATYQQLQDGRKWGFEFISWIYYYDFARYNGQTSFTIKISTLKAAAPAKK